MLARSRISFETPNVIDPGDKPPSAPERSLQKDFENRGSGSNRVNISPSDDNRGIYKPPLSRTIKINYQDDADEEPNDLLQPVNLDPEFGETKEEPLSPGMEQTRLFAAAMLSESERRGSSQSTIIFGGSNHKRFSIGIGSPVRLKALFGDNPEESYLRDSLGLDYPMEKWRDDRRKRCRRGFVIVAAAAVLVTVFALFIGKEQAEKMSYRMSTTKDFLIQHNYGAEKDLSDPSTPQYKAASWIADQDEDRLPIAESVRFVQRYVLAVLYYSLGGSEWTQSLGFLSSEHECSWNVQLADENKEIFAVGASCDRNLQVNSLLIPSNNLKGSIPDEIRHLKQLNFISMKHNELTGTIPSALTHLTMMEYFDVKFNLLEGTIPDFLGELERLQVLGLSKNNLVGSLPRSLGTLRLKTLALDDNALTGDLGSIRLMTSLNYLYAQNNSFQGNMFHGVMMADMQSLVEVDLSGNALTATDIPAHIFSLPKLELFDASNNKISGKFPDDIPKNVMMRYLSLRDNEMDSSIPESIYNLNQLTHLDLENNSLVGDLPESLATMGKLQYLFLGKNFMNVPAIPTQLKTLRHLRELSLDNLGIQGAIPDWIADLSNLSLLDMRENNLTGTLDTVDWSKMQRLKYLTLHDNNFEGTLPEKLGTMTSLLVLSVYRNNLTGTANPVCDGMNDMYWLATDCQAITCDCCDECCGGDECYASTTWDDLENKRWDQHYSRADYSFNPNILSSAKQPRGGRH